MPKNMYGLRNPIPTTDVIIQYKSKGLEGIVFVERKNPPYGLALPGGFAEYGISLPDNARKEAKEETNLELRIQNEEKPFCVMSDPERDPRAHMISITYIANGYGKLQAGDDAKKVCLKTLDEAADLVREKKLAFDHGEIVRKYLITKGYEL